MSSNPSAENQVAPDSAAAVAQAEEGSLLDKIIADGRLGRDDEQRESARHWIGEFVYQMMAGQMTLSRDTQAMINARLGQLDALISKQLNAVMHHEDFQSLEASWRG